MPEGLEGVEVYNIINGNKQTVEEADIVTNTVYGRVINNENVTVLGDYTDTFNSLD